MSSDSPPIRPVNLSRTRVSPVAPSVMVRVVALPESLQNNAALLKLEGQIDSRNDQGSTLVKTPQGMIEIILKDQQAYPQGSYLTLELPAGRPPHLATILSSTLTAPLSTQTAIDGDGTPTSATTIASQSPTAPQVTLGRQGMLEPHMLESFLLYNLTNQGRGAGIGGISAKNTPPATSMINLLPLSSQILQNIQGSINITTASGLLSRLLNALQNQAYAPSSSQTIFQIAGNFLNQVGTGTAQGQANLSGANITVENLIGQLRNLLNSSMFQGSGSSLQSESPGSNNFPIQSLNAQILGNLSESGSANHFFTSTSAATPIALSMLVGFTQDQKPILAMLTGTGFESPPQPGSSSTAINYYVVNIATGDHNLDHNHVISLLRSDPSQLLFLGLGGLSAASQPSELAMGLSSGFGGGWGTLNQILGLINGDSIDSQSLSAAPHSPQHMLLNMMPSPAHPRDFSTLALFFMAIARAGDIDQFLPITMLNTLKQTAKGKALLDQLSLDLSHFARMDQAMLPPDWKGMIIPFAWQNQILKVPMYFKDDPQEDVTDSDTEPHRKRRLRFLFDLQLSRMGGVQVDGFLKSQRLDLILRTKTALSPLMQHDMRKLYAGAVEKSNLTGELSFQSRADQWVNFPTNQTQENPAMWA